MKIMKNPSYFICHIFRCVVSVLLLFFAPASAFAFGSTRISSLFSAISSSSFFSFRPADAKEHLALWQRAMTATQNFSKLLARATAMCDSRKASSLRKLLNYFLSSSSHRPSLLLLLFPHIIRKKRGQCARQRRGSVCNAFAV